MSRKRKNPFWLKEKHFEAAYLKSLLKYEPGTGIFTWTAAAAPRVRGKVAGTRKVGAVLIAVDGVHLYAHRVAWLFIHNEWPVDLVDHINGNPYDNRIQNIRVVTASGNCQNQAVSIKNKSGYIGVHWDKARQKWQASIGHLGENIRLGRFDDKEQAFAAYCAAKARLHSFHPEPVLRRSADV